MGVEDARLLGDHALALLPLLGGGSFFNAELRGGVARAHVPGGVEHEEPSRRRDREGRLVVALLPELRPSLPKRDLSESSLRAGKLSENARTRFPDIMIARRRVGLCTTWRVSISTREPMKSALQ